MKLRNGFVSNSSSSSFCIYGTTINRKMFDELEDSDLLAETDLSLESYDEGDQYWIGKEWSSIGDDETGKQFKETIETQIEKVLGVKTKCGTYDEAWYEG